MANSDDPVIARLAALETELASLRAQLDEAHAVRDRTMRAQGRCRACDGDVILRADKMLDRSHLGIPAPMAIAQTDNWTPKPIGLIEAYICAGCGLIEWYVKDPGTIPVDGERISRLPGRPPGAPYR